MKRLSDKCRELLLEVEAQEARLHSQSGRIQAEQASLREEVVRAMNELLQVSQSLWSTIYIYTHVIIHTHTHTHVT